MNILNANNKDTDKIVNIKLTDIYPDPENRKVGGFDEIKLKELSNSIKSIGVMQPIIVRKKSSGGYDLIAGERRWRASKLANRETIPSVVKVLTDEDVLHFQIIENLQREDIHPLDECHGFFRLMTGSLAYTPRDIAIEIGKSESYVTQRLKLKNLIPKAVEAFEENKIHLGHAILIARLESDGQIEALKYTIPSHHWESQATVKLLREWIERNIYLNLTKAVFSKKDNNLIKEASACLACNKRTDWDPALFPEINDEAFCLDAKCFNAKLEQHIENQKELDIPHIAGDYSKPPEGAYKMYEVTQWNPDWDDPDPQDNIEVPDKLTFEECLVVTGPDRGKIVLARIDSETDDEDEESPEEIKKRKAEQREDDILRKQFEIFNDKVFKEILENLKAQDYMIVSKEFLVLTIKALLDTQIMYHIDLTKKAHGWVETEQEDIFSELTNLNTYELITLLQEIIIEGLIPGWWDKESDTTFTDFAKEKGVDIESLQHESRLEAEAKYEEEKTETV